MKLFTSLILLFLATSFSPAGDDVYICDSKGAKKYHLVQNCKGLSNCKSDIIKISKEKAVASGKSLCGWED